MALPKLYTYREVADAVGLSVSRLRKLVMSGELVASVQDRRRTGRRFIRFTEQDIRNWMDRRGVRIELAGGSSPITSEGQTRRETRSGGSIQS